jgi:hypothetical protein
MTVNRVPEVPFAQIANAMLRDVRLSYKARGLLAMVLSNTGDWDTPREWLVSQSEKDGRESVQSALNELTELGYRRVTRGNNPENGLFQTIVEWSHEPNQWDRPTGNPTDGQTDGRKTRRTTENNPEHYSVTKVTAESAQTLIAEWIDHCASRPPGRVIGQVAKEVGALLGESIPYETVREGLGRWHRLSLHPSAVASVVNEVLNPATASRGKNPSTAIQAGKSLVERLEAEAAAQSRMIEGARS